MDSSYTLQVFNGNGTSKTLVDCWVRELNEKSDTRFYRIDLFDEHSVRDISTQNPALVLIPGGESIKIKDSISKVAHQIANVENHASLYASCAGLIVGSTHYTENEYTNKVTDWSQYSGLNFNSEIEIFAPYSVPVKHNRASLYNRTSIKLECVDPRWNKVKEYFSYYALGPGLLITDKVKNSADFDVIEYYQTGGRKQDRRGHFASTVIHKLPLSKHLFTGVHPECGMQDLARIPNIDVRNSAISYSSPYEHLKDSLDKYEILRQHRLHENLRLLDLKVKPIDQCINTSNVDMSSQIV